MPPGPPGQGGGVGVRRRVAVAIAVVALVLGSLAAAQAIGFTVQVIAVSDQTNALDISRGLLRDGFPAYVVRSTGGQGDVYRVRVGAFANRAAAVRYAAAMPGIGGTRPVPALAEAIPAGIMEWTPRVLWQGSVAGADLRVLAWPDGIALRRQAADPLREATYELVQGAEVRTVRAWRIAPLASLPPSLDLIEVPFVDLTVGLPASERAASVAAAQEDDAPDAAADGRPDPADGPAEAPGAAPGDVPASDAPGDEAAASPPGAPDAEGPGAPPAAAETLAPVEAPVETPGEDPAEESGEVVGGAADEAAAAAAASAAEAAGPVWAEPAGEVREVGLLLLRDRSLWPPTWAEDGEEVRGAFRSATLALVATRVGLAPREVEAHAYFPGGGPPPALVVVELSDRSGRDLGDVRALADPRSGLRAEGPPPAAGSDPTWWPIGGIGERVPLQGEAAEPLGGPDWTLTADGGFVRITLPTGASWRAIAGALLWSDGRYVLVRDGDDVVLADFLMR